MNYIIIYIAQNKDGQFRMPTIRNWARIRAEAPPNVITSANVLLNLRKTFVCECLCVHECVCVSEVIQVRGRHPPKFLSSRFLLLLMSSVGPRFIAVNT